MSENSEGVVMVIDSTMKAKLLRKRSPAEVPAPPPPPAPRLPWTPTGGGSIPYTPHSALTCGSAYRLQILHEFFHSCMLIMWCWKASISRLAWADLDAERGQGKVAVDAKRGLGQGGVTTLFQCFQGTNQEGSANLVTEGDVLDVHQHDGARARTGCRGSSTSMRLTMMLMLGQCLSMTTT
ncbi:hypothetical protein GUJ93_ZPchr0012g21220 [Zizania palustris]|uniref:Uncharacterized protein n=1 Tax=Zizania palustris TaxID=103762 RepID=A0A8J5WSL9_ZIZPA|nr:hypothetical protein GUJ93_ZPchr0012g21220 [Zizania palustris]